MGLDALLAELTRTAHAEEERIRADGNARETSILRAGEEAVRIRRESELARITAAEREAVRRDTAAAEQSHRIQLLETRARLMGEVFARAEAALADADGSRYQEAIPALVRATLPYLEGQHSVLRCRADVASAVQAACGCTSGIKVEGSPDFEAGVLGETRDGAVTVDNRLVSLLERRREDLAIELARRLESS